MAQNPRPDGSLGPRPDDAPRPGSDGVLRGRVVTLAGTLDDGLVLVDGERISWVGEAAQAPAGVPVPPPPAPGTTVLPGLVDLHCHGGGGAGFGEATDPAQVAAAVGEHLRHGTTALVASLVTADRRTLGDRTALLADAADAGQIEGIHIEGPFLAAARCGAQDPSLMAPGDPELVRSLAAAARGHLLTMTVAPEVDGVLGAGGVIDVLAEVGAVPSIGHTDADHALTEEALRRSAAALSGPGSRSTRPTVTHLFNGMPALHHRAPGPVAACLAAAARGEAVVELVADGVHLDHATVRTVMQLVGPASVALVTDAMAAAGMPDGDYRLGAADVRVRGGVARLPGGALAGGTAHLLDVVRGVVDSGAALSDAVHAASTTPATVLGRPDLGALETGRRADVVVTDGALHPIGVMQGGRWVA